MLWKLKYVFQDIFHYSVWMRFATFIEGIHNEWKSKWMSKETNLSSRWVYSLIKPQHFEFPLLLQCSRLLYPWMLSDSQHRLKLPSPKVVNFTKQMPAIQFYMKVCRKSGNFWINNMLHMLSCNNTLSTDLMQLRFIFNANFIN